MGIINFFRGSIKIYGKDREILALADEMTKRNIPFGSLQREDESLLVFRAPYGKKEQIALLSSKLGISPKFEILGLPRLAELYKKRIGLFVGITLVFLLILLSNMFILSFEVVGNERLQSEYVLSLLESQGLKIGTLKKSHDLRMIALNAELACDDIAWLAVNFNGTKAVIEMRETKKKPDMYDNSTPTDLIAKCDGQIIYTEAVSGSIVCKRYDVVKEGDLLISGVVDSKAYGYKLVRSRGRVLAKTYRSFTVSVPLEKEVKEYTGKHKSVKSFTLFGKSILKPKVYKGFKNYDVTEKKELLSFFGSINLPVTKVSSLYKEYVPKTVIITPEEAKAEALSEIADMIADEIGKGEILERTEIENVTDTEYVLTVSLYCIEDICSEKPIDNDWENVLE